MIHSYVIGRGNTATAYLQAGMIRPVPDATADAVVDVQAALGRRVPGEATLSWAGRTPTPNAGGKAPQKIYWEGNILNKISKKIVALVTMAAFVLTLVPFAAFAASDVDFDKSSYTITAGTDGTLKVTLDLNQTGGSDATVTNANVKISVTDLNSATTVSGGTTATTVADLEAKGDTPAAATQVYTFSNVPTGNHTVTVSVIGDTTTENTPTTLKTASQNPAYVSNAASTENSFLDISTEKYEGQKEVSVAAGTELDIRFNVMDKYNVACDASATLGTNPYAYIWAQKEDKTVTSLVTFVSDTATISNSGNVNKLSAVANENSVKAIFNAPGTYYIYAGVSAKTNAYNAAGTTTDTIFSTQGVTLLKDCVKVTVTAPEQTTEKIVVDQPSGMTMTVDGTEYTITPNTIENADGTKVFEVTGTAKQANGNPAQYETLNITTNKPNSLQILTPQVATDVKGNFSFKFVATKNENCKIFVEESNGDAKATINFNNAKTEASEIAVAKDGGYVLAGNDSKYASSVTYTNNTNLFADAVQFTITDKYGNELTGDLKDTVFNNGKDTVLIQKKADDSTLEATDLNLAWNADKGVYTLVYVGTSAAKDLIPGEYKVRVSLDSGDYAEASFNVAKFGTVEDLVIDLTAQNTNTENKDAITQIDDQVALGETVKATTSYVDANGLKVPANVICSFNGSAVNDANKTDNTFIVKDDLGYVGTTITVKAYDDSAKKFVEKTVTVVDGYQDETLAFDPTEGTVDKNNTVNVTVVDKDGNLSKVNGELDAYVESQSNEEANVDVTVNKNVNNGKGTLTIYSDKETSVDVVVVVKANNGEMYGQTLTYTVGNKDINADKSVVMTIGSSDYVVNNQLVAGDAAPYVADNRTMVPIRALTEAFGAKVDFENNVVTIVDGDTTIAMTIGETTYTVNGEEATMDVAPVIGSGDRTYVPVRFVGEALGYEVTALYAADGTTASVVFQK